MSRLALTHLGAKVRELAREIESLPPDTDTEEIEEEISSLEDAIGHQSDEEEDEE